MSAVQNEIRILSPTGVCGSIPRPYFQGDPRDSDGHGGQQYVPLMDIDIP